MNDIIKICGIAIVGVIAVGIMRGLKNDFAGYVSIATGTILFGWALAAAYPLIEYVKTITEGNVFSPYTETVLKALGIAIVSESAADICRDFGETAIASKVEFAAKSVILLLAMPVVMNLLKLAFGVME